MNAKRPKWFCRSTPYLLLANHKTPQQLLRLVVTSPFSQVDIERTFEEVKDYELLEKCILLASSQNINVVDAAIEMRTVTEAT